MARESAGKWWCFSVLAGIAAVPITCLVLTLPPKGAVSLVSGVLVFLWMSSRNPVRWYRRMAAMVMATWAGVLLAFAGTISIELTNHAKLTFDGHLGWPIHATLGAVFALLVIVDFLTHRRPALPTHSEPDSDLESRASESGSVSTARTAKVLKVAPARLRRWARYGANPARWRKQSPLVDTKNAIPELRRCTASASGDASTTSGSTHNSSPSSSGKPNQPRINPSSSSAP